MKNAMTSFSLKLGEEVPNFDLKTTKGGFKLHDYIKKDSDKNPFTILLSHPSDYTPVCTTELGRAETLCDEFKKRGAKLIGLSTNSLDDHKQWIKDILHCEGKSADCLSFPIIADDSRDIATSMGILDPRTIGKGQSQPLASRALVVIDKECKVRLAILYPSSTGRNFDEILRVVDSLTVADKYSVATPVDWKSGEKVIVPPSLSTEEAKKTLSDVETVKVPSGKDYLRFARVRE
jgi:1-Cys peroxiredoxin 6